MCALGPLRLQVDGGADHAGGNLGQLCLDVESEGSELADVDTLASPQVVVEIGDETSPDDKHL